MQFKSTFLLLVLCLLFTNCKEQSNTQPEIKEDQVHGRLEVSNHNSEKNDLYYLLKEKDSLMFELSYNQLNTSILEELATDDIEFYHDQGGATYTKQDFIHGMKGLGNLSYKARRELVKGSTEVFPMYKNGEIYAAILKGEHAFYAKEPNEKPEYLTSTAKYTTLWILVNGEWKMSRIYSYDHQAPNN
ncbi:nuclear transport factor 2 family protein [Pontimicrobium aquaticum]|uniref:Nuclear transport factor 2 family protein n=1 Tax=Pontimicrobium aquaticum TaxID=2565367 RepID=A0A4U0EZ83_9FLAO|nr:nuclear transport factor 2 family protein [Pontimicrobium aquaticum]TJY37353.1 nuclear transport factor 2 family protein [Pontimicrobium aquaticum]